MSSGDGDDNPRTCGDDLANSKFNHPQPPHLKHNNEWGARWNSNSR